MEELNDFAQLALATGGLGFLAGETWGAYPSDSQERFCGLMPLYEKFISPEGTPRQIDWDKETGIRPLLLNGREFSFKVNFNNDKEEYAVKVYVVSRNGNPVFLLRCPEIFDHLYPEEPAKVRQMAFIGKAAIEMFDKIHGIEGDASNVSALRLNEPQLGFAEVARRNFVANTKTEQKKDIWGNTKIFMTTHTPEAAALPRYNTKWLTSQIGSDMNSCPYEEFNLALYLADKADAINAVSPEHAEVTSECVLPGKKINGILNGSDPKIWKSKELLAIEEKGERVTGEILFKTGQSSKIGLNAFLTDSVGASFNDLTRPMAGLVRRLVEYKEQGILLPMIAWICGDPAKDYDTPWIKNSPKNRGLGMNLLVGGIERDTMGSEWAEKFRKIMEREDLKGKFIFIENTGVTLMKHAVNSCDVWISIPRPTREAAGTSDQRAALCGHLNIATNTGGPKEYIEHGLNGWLIDVFYGEPLEKVIAGFNAHDQNYIDKFHADASDELSRYLKAAVNIYKNDPRSWKSMMKASYDIAAQKVDIRNMIEKYIDLYREFIYKKELPALSPDQADAAKLLTDLGRLVADSTKKKKDLGRPVNIMIAGSPGSLKSTISKAIKEILEENNIKTGFVDTGAIVFGDISFEAFDNKHADKNAIIVEVVNSVPPDYEKVDLLIRTNGNLGVRQDRIMHGSKSYQYAQERTEVEARTNIYRDRPPDIIINTDPMSIPFLEAGHHKYFIKQGFNGAPINIEYFLQKNQKSRVSAESI
ncbi:MAG: glycosyltransferase [Candidatus Omnitrophota bacterium]